MKKVIMQVGLQVSKPVIMQVVLQVIMHPPKIFGEQKSLSLHSPLEVTEIFTYPT